MLWLLVLLFVITGISGYLLFAPFYLEINSSSGICRVRFHRIASVSLILADSSLKIGINIAGLKKQIDLFAPSVKNLKPAKPASVKKKRRAIRFRAIWAVIKSFKINRLYVDIDTGDLPLNSVLYPFVYLFSVYTKNDVAVNFEGRNEIILEIENNFARIIKAYIFHSFTNKRQKTWKT